MFASRKELRDAQEAYRAELEEVTGLSWDFVPTGGGCSQLRTEQLEWFATVSCDAEAPVFGETVLLVFGIDGSRTVNGEPCDDADDRQCETARGVFADLVTLCNIHAVAYPSAWV